jgi:hypothetical protein
MAANSLSASMGMNRQLDRKENRKQTRVYLRPVDSFGRKKSQPHRDVNYPVLILSAVIAIGQFALHPRHVPAIRLKPALEENPVRIGLAEI